MREVEELLVWSKLKKARGSTPSELFEYAEHAVVDLGKPCTVVGGLNGSGKTRLLRSIATELGSDSLLLDMHYLCEQALIVLRSRPDVSDMSDEVGTSGPDADRRNDVERIIGRRYEELDWFSLDLEPDDETVADRFRWDADQSLIPHFSARHRGIDYSSLDMGLGEFSTHFLFWILDQFRERANLVLLLDEPDAYLPPIGAARLLRRLLRLCLKRGWRMVLTTHSEEIIATAIEEESFALIRWGRDDLPIIDHVAANPATGRTLLARPPVEHILFCEDESAKYLAEALLRHSDESLLRRSAVVWGNGHGYLRGLHTHLPKVHRPRVKFAYIFDGDQRGRLPASDNAWTTLCLPTESDPDTLFVSVGSLVDELAVALGAEPQELEVFLSTIEGSDVHDWVDVLGMEFGRAIVLSALARLWVQANADTADGWTEELRKGWE